MKMIGIISFLSIPQCCIDRIKQVLFVKGLIQKCHSTSFQNLSSYVGILVRRDKNYRQVCTLRTQVTLQARATHTRHPHVKNRQSVVCTWFDLKNASAE